VLVELFVKEWEYDVVVFGEFETFGVVDFLALVDIPFFSDGLDVDAFLEPGGDGCDAFESAEGDFSFVVGL